MIWGEVMKYFFLPHGVGSDEVLFSHSLECSFVHRAVGIKHGGKGGQQRCAIAKACVVSCG